MGKKISPILKYKMHFYLIIKKQIFMASCFINNFLKFLFCMFVLSVSLNNVKLLA